MPGLPDCHACPFRDDPDTLCWCAANGFVGMCDGLAGRRRADQVEGFRRVIVENTTGVTQPEPAPPPVMVERKADLVPLATNLAVLRCPHRTKLPACGCAGKWRCERDAADVAWADCVACKAREA